MKCCLKYNLLLVLFSLFFFVDLFAWEKYEHQIIANLAFDSTLSFCGIKFTESFVFIPGKNSDITINRLLWSNKSFGNITSFFSGDDISQSRCQIKGYTIQQQLEPLSAEIIDNVWERIKNSPEDIQSVEVPNQNVVYNYLLYHLIALRFAELSGEDNQDVKEYLRYALIYEAVAQSYLSDAFSAGHLLLPVFDFLAPLNSNNIRINHDFYCSEGVYVINAEGDCWRTFGDRLLQWYAPTFNHVFDVSVKSLLEVFLVYLVSNNIDLPNQLSKWAISIDSELSPGALIQLWLNTYNGEDYYSEIKMPSLICIPMPVAATWSVRTERVDSYGIHIRINYPQLREDKFHDPDLNGIDTEFLYSSSLIPNWMIPEFLPNDTLQSLIRYHPDIASVRFIQNRYLPPSYQGLLLSAGTAVVLSDASNNFGISLGTGWGFADEFLYVIVKPSINISATHLFGDSSVWIIIADLGFGINFPVFNMLYPRLDFGYARGFQSPYNGGAGKISLGLDLKTLPLGFTYAGLTFRLNYQFIFFDKTIHSIVLEILLH